MKNSNKSSIKPSLVDKWFLPAISLLSFGGFIDASYLTISHFRGVAVACNLSSGCETVTNSAYSSILGLPVALLGVFFYLAIFILIVAYFDWRQEWLLKVIFSLSLAAFGFSLWFVGVQIFAIGAFCQYCLLSAGISTAIFSLSWWRVK